MRRSAKEALKNLPGKTRGSSHFWNWSRKNRRTLPVSRGRSARKLEIRFFLGHISGSFPAEFTDNYETKHGESCQP